MEENFSPQDSLQVIQSMIEKAKNQFSENGFLYLLWGWLILFCSLGEFVLIRLHYEQHYQIWFLAWAATIYQFFYIIKKRRKARVKTYADTIIGFVWFTFFIVLMLVIFVIAYSSNSDYYKLFGPVLIALYGMPTFLSGILLRFRPLIIGAIGCWLLSIGCRYVNTEYQLLFISAAMIVAWIIPGYILRNKYQKQLSDGR